MRFRFSSALLLPFLVLNLSGLGCGIGTTVETSLDPVDAMDDGGVTFMDNPINILVLANDLQDDDLVTLVENPMDDMGNVQAGAAEIDFLKFPEQITYQPPAGFTGTVTFDYTITGLGITYDYTTTDTATVTVTVTPGMPDVLAVDDMEITDLEEPVVIDVLMNDFQDADVIDSFSDAMDEMGTVQVGSVAIQTNGTESLLYTPPLGFAGPVTFDYSIVGLGIDFEFASEDTATVFVEVDPPVTTATVQFADRSEEVFEVLLFYITQESIDNSDDNIFASDAEIFGPGEETGCFEVEAGDDVPVRANLLIDDVAQVDGVCDVLFAGAEYTIQVQPDGLGGLEIVCLDGLADPSLCP